jgi:hypothetical protein
MNLSETTKAELERNLSELRYAAERLLNENRRLSEERERIYGGIMAIEFLLEIPRKDIMDKEAPEPTKLNDPFSAVGVVQSTYKRYTK